MKLLLFIILPFCCIFLPMAHASNAYIVDYYNLELPTLIDVKGVLSTEDKNKLANEKKNVEKEFYLALRTKISRNANLNGQSLTKKKLNSLVAQKMTTISVKKQIQRIFVQQMSKKLRFDPAAKSRKCNLSQFKQALQNININNKPLNLLRQAAYENIYLTTALDFSEKDAATLRFYVNSDGTEEEIDNSSVKLQYAQDSQNCVTEKFAKATLLQQLESKDLQGSIIESVERIQEKETRSSDDFEMSDMLNFSEN